MDRLIIPSLILGAVMGLIFGILLLVPSITPLTVILLFLSVGPITICYLKKSSFIGILNLQDGTLIGAAGGFTALIISSVIYLPSAYLIDKFFTDKPEATFTISNALSLTSYDFLVTSMLVVFTAMLCSLFNAFSGMVTTYIFEKTEGKPLEFKDHIDLEEN